jgi:mannose-6-phosphate isomerase class I
LKVLSAARPLSIQVHPDARGARAGFARENAAGIPHSAPERNYKDEHHKPELLVALTDFWALRGFRPLEEIGRLTAEVPELAVLWSDLRPDLDSLRTGYVRCMTLAQDEVDSVLEPLIARLRHLDHENPFPPHGREYWVLRADREFSRVGHHDRGIFSLFLLNFVHLGPGEAIYLPAGILHAYLNGSALEIMASSNNVLRGGLTSKHVDVAELLANVRFEAGPAEILRGIPLGAGGEWIYRTTAREFELRRIELQAAVSHRGQAHPSAEILLVVEAQGHAPVHVSTSARRLSLRRGNSVFVPFGAGYSLSAEAKAVVYKAGIPWDGETGGEVLGKDTMGNKDRKDRKDRKENKDFEVE